MVDENFQIYFVQITHFLLAFFFFFSKLFFLPAETSGGYVKSLIEWICHNNSIPLMKASHNSIPVI